MPSLLTSWVTSNPHIIVASTQLQVDPTCPVVINSLQPKSCLVAFILPPTDPPTDLPDCQERSLLLKSGCFSCPCCDDCYCCHSDSSGSVLQQAVKIQVSANYLYFDCLLQNTANYHTNSLHTYMHSHESTAGLQLVLCIYLISWCC